MHEAFTDGAHLLLIGSLIIGYITGEDGKTMMGPFTAEIFKGILAFFLLEMGLLVARQLREAALAEDDPVLRERLWEEYRKYSGN